jgi:hypothetical protein
MSPTPRISQLATEATDRRAALISEEQPADTIDLAPPLTDAERLATLKLDPDEEGMTYDEVIAKRTAEVAQAQADSRRLTAVTSQPDTVAAMPAPIALANVIAEAVAKMTTEDNAAREVRKNVNRVANAPVVKTLTDRLAAVKTAFKATRAEHLVNLTDLAAVDVAAARRRIPVRVTPGSSYDNHQALALLTRAAATARDGVSTGFDEAERLHAMLESVIDSHAETASHRCRKKRQIHRRCTET